MWILTLVILINLGESPAKFEIHKFTSETLCMQAMKKLQTETKIGYCSKE